MKPENPAITTVYTINDYGVPIVNFYLYGLYHVAEMFTTYHPTIPYEIYITPAGRYSDGCTRVSSKAEAIDWLTKHPAFASIVKNVNKNMLHIIRDVANQYFYFEKLDGIRNFKKYNPEGIICRDPLFSLYSINSKYK